MVLERRLVFMSFTAAASSRSSAVAPNAVASSSPFAALCSDAVTARSGAEKRSTTLFTSQSATAVPAATVVKVSTANTATGKRPAANRNRSRPSAASTQPASASTAAMKRRFSGELKKVASIMVGSTRSAI